MQTILVSGFGAFQSFSRNPSQDLALRLQGLIVEGIKIETIILPVSWRDAWVLLEEKIKEINPICWIGFGLAPDPYIRFETTARNKMDKYLDIDGLYPSSNTIIRDADEKIITNLPIEWLQEELIKYNEENRTEDRINSIFSDDAGGYLCNYIFFHTMYLLQNTNICCGFIHIPSYSENEINNNSNIITGEFMVYKTIEWLNMSQKLL